MTESFHSVFERGVALPSVSQDRSGHDTGRLDAALALLKAVEAGLVAARSGIPLSNPAM
ncbi:hypothetical protein [Nonomuraea sp. SYSU D8015]|uniref:hypothetical protein n=1 Tax=Nonomuraea sp. SYSU D8015 TaxID=2593644 RepID=UPI001660D922|nr:hypothetical protein [Nonomuraea sp. SYSU D8015]